MYKLGFEEKKRLFAKIILFIKKFISSSFEVKTPQKKMDAAELEGDDYDHQKERMNGWLNLEYNKNLALIEIQRQRAT